MHKVLLLEDGKLCYGILERDSMFCGGWKISYKNSCSCIFIAHKIIYDNYGFDEYMKDVEKEELSRLDV